MKKLLLIAIFALVSSISAQCQIYNYEYKYSITEDGGKTLSSYLDSGTIFYFSFNNDFSMCYLVDKNGTRSDVAKYEFVGLEDEMMKYQNTLNSIEDYLFFAEDYSELLWDASLEKNDEDEVRSIRYLEYVE